METKEAKRKKRNELKQIAKAIQFLRKTNKMEDDLNGNEVPLRSSQPPKDKSTTIKDFGK